MAALLLGEEEKIINFLQQTADASSVSEIADKTGIDKRNLHLSLRKLKKKGLVLCTSSKPQKWYIMPVNQVMGEIESEQDSVFQKLSTSQQNREQMILQHMKQHREPKSAIQIAKGLGLTTRKEVNPTLYKLEKKKIIKIIKNQEKGPPLWRLDSDMDKDAFKNSRNDQNAPGAYLGPTKGGSHTQRNIQNRSSSYHSDPHPSSREKGGKRGREAKYPSGSKRRRRPVQVHSQSCPPNSHLHAEMGRSPGHMLANDQSPPLADSSAIASTEGDNSQVNVIESKNMDSDSCDVWEEESIDTDGDFDDFDCETADRFGDLMGHRLNDTRFDIICHDDEEGDMELLKKILLLMKCVPNCTSTAANLADILKITVKDIETALKFGKSRNYVIEGGIPMFWNLTEEGKDFLKGIKEESLIHPEPIMFGQGMDNYGPSSISDAGMRGLWIGPPPPPKELIQRDPVFAGDYLKLTQGSQFPIGFGSSFSQISCAGRGQVLQKLSNEYGAQQNSKMLPTGAIYAQELEASQLPSFQPAASAASARQHQPLFPIPFPHTLVQSSPDFTCMQSVPGCQSSSTTIIHTPGSLEKKGLIMVRPIVNSVQQTSSASAAVEFLGHQLDNAGFGFDIRGNVISPSMEHSGPLSLDSAIMTRSHSQPVLGSGPMSLPVADSSGPSLKITSESFAALNKNPISALMEYAQSRHLQARIDVISQKGPSHRPVFAVAAWVGNRQFPAVTCNNKKDGRKEAADVALRTLIAEGQYTAASQTPSINVSPENMTHFDKIAALTHQAFNSLIASIPENLAGRKVIAGLVMKRSVEDIGLVVSIGTGNRCITGDKLSLEGNTVNDSHAEIITRRGFLRFLYQQLMTYQNGKPHEIFEPGNSGKLRVQSGITFHLYISTAPCGDGALFSPRDTESNNGLLPNIDRREHQPTFTSNVQGLLRTKMEGGEGTIPVDASEITVQTWDGVVRGERLRTMSCTDKICRWNVLGLQGALLSHLLEPIYLDSLTLGFLYDHGHLARAVCCRLDREAPPLDTRLPAGFHLNHPWLGRVTACQPLRETQKTKAYSINWTVGDVQPEVLDGTLGHCYTAVEKTIFSRLAKRSLYNSFKQVAQCTGRNDLLQFSCYREAKMSAKDFQKAKMAMMEKFKETRCGAWVKKPVEEEMFS